MIEFKDIVNTSRLISLFKTPIIEFLVEPNDLEVIPLPTAAIKNIPDWFKRISPKVPDGRDVFGSAAFSVKKCLPILDAMSLGFIIPLAGDVNVRTNKDNSLIEVGKNPYCGDIIQFHDNEQLGGKLGPTGRGPAIKFINRIIVKTAPGVSCLFTPCINHLENRFTCLSGVVDTDVYPKQVNFPAIWNIPNFDDRLEAGTPLMTVIPFYRDKMPNKANTRVMNDNDLKTWRRIDNIQRSRSGHYTNELRKSRKS